MSRENPLWGAPRIHGELLKLGIEIAQSTVAKYMQRRREPPSQGWKTFLRNHAPHIGTVDLFVVPTAVGLTSRAQQERLRCISWRPSCSVAASTLSGPTLFFLNRSPEPC
jgi:hypothetical protein